MGRRPTLIAEEVPKSGADMLSGLLLEVSKDSL